MNYVGFKPYSHQRAVIDEVKDAKGTGKVVCCKSSRQKGKSLMLANLLLYFAINYKQTKNYCVSPTLKQAKNIFQTIMDAIEGTGIIKLSNSTDLYIKLINNSQINFKSAEQRAGLRGYTADFLCVDEACFIEDDIFYGLVLPWADAKKAPIVMTSTPFIKEGFFWKYYNFGLEKSHNTVTIDWCDERFKEDIEKILPPEKLEEYRSFLPAKTFSSEYLGLWLDDDGVVFTNYKNCIYDGLISPTDKLWVGIDWSNQTDNDDTVISVLNQDGHQVLLKYWNNLTPLGQIDMIYEVLKPLEKQIVVIQPELNSVGTPYTDLLKNRLQVSTRSKVRGFNTSNSSKAQLVSNLQVAFESCGIGILNDERQLRQLGTYSAEYNPKTKNVSYNAPQGLHDDICIALMLSYDAWKNNKSSGVYSMSFNR